MVFTEATAVQDIGRISPQDTGLYLDEHIPMMKHIVSFIHSQNAAAGIQLIFIHWNGSEILLIRLAHAGRKASTISPFVTSKTVMFPSSAYPMVSEKDGGWQIVGPSPIAWGPDYATPHELSIEEIQGEYYVSWIFFFLLML